jgi:tetratricopeptide (TPR) repeat protein
MSLADKAKAHFDSACAYLQRGRVTEAIEQLGMAIAVDLRPEYFFHRAHLYLQLTDIDSANKDLAQAEELLRDSEDSEMTFGDIEQLRGQIANHAKSSKRNRQAIDECLAQRRLEPLLNELGFGSVAPQLLSLVRPSFRLKPTGGTAPTGSSRLGGYPDLPHKFSWPNTTGGVPMAFVCQISLAAVGKVGEAAGLPALGMLYLFYDATTLAKQQVGEYALICRPVAEPLFNTHSPFGTPQENSFFEAAVMLVTEDCLPDFTSPAVAALLPPTAKQAYDELLHLWYGSPPWHRLLGYSQGVQDCLESILSGGKLLLQIDSDAECCMQWGDGGRLYVGIREQRPLVINQENCRVYLQSY